MTTVENAPVRARPDAPPPPYRAYASIVAAFGALLAGTGLVARRRPLPQRSWLDLTILVLATFKAARTLTDDEVTSFVRAPFVEGEAHEGGEEPVKTGDIQQALGELVTCSRCIGTWVAASLAALQVATPRFGRLLSWTLGVAGANDVAQAGFAALTAKANQLQ